MKKTVTVVYREEVFTTATFTADFPTDAQGEHRGEHRFLDEKWFDLMQSDPDCEVDTIVVTDRWAVSFDVVDSKDTPPVDNPPVTS
jgi:hypothetical protein